MALFAGYNRDRDRFQQPLPSVSSSSSSSSSSISSNDQMPKRADHRDACNNDILECNPYWYASNAPARGIIQLLGSFMVELTSLLIMVSYDTSTAPLSLSLAIALPFFLVLSISPSYHFNPVLTLVGGLIPLTPCAVVSDPEPAEQSRTSNGPSKSPAYLAGGVGFLLLQKLPRVAYDVTAQIVGSIVAAVLVWQVMNMSGTDILSRFDSQVRADVVNDSFGGGKVFFYVLLFSAMFAVIYYGVRFADTKTTCVTVQQRLNPVKVGVVSLAYFIFIAALAPIIGVGSLNLLVTIGPAVATGIAPAYYGSVVGGQIVGYTFVALAFRYGLFAKRRTCGCAKA